MRHHHIVVAALLLSGGTQSALAANYDEKQPFICAPVRIMSCVPAGNCARETAQSANIPQFLIFDIARKEITGRRPDGKAVTTAIEDVKQTDAALVLQGIEGAFMWSVMIGNGGDMILTAGGNKTGYVAFGSCALS